MLHARTPKDRTFGLVTPDRLKMEATAQVLNAFPLESFPLERKGLSSLQELFYQHTLYKTEEMSVGLKTMAIMTPLYSINIQW